MPWRALDAGNYVGAVPFLLVAVAVSVGGEWFQRARREADRVNRDLARREAHLRSILETVPDAMIVIDEAGLMRDFSKAAERLFGWDAQETFGRNVSMLMPAPYREAHDGYLQRYYGPASDGSSGSAGSSSASEATGRPSRWNWRSARCASTGSATSPASSAT